MAATPSTKPSLFPLFTVLILLVAIASYYLYINKEASWIKANTREEIIQQLSPSQLVEFNKAIKFPNATLILPHLYLGSASNAADETFLTENNITTIFHLAAELPVFQLASVQCQTRSLYYKVHPVDKQVPLFLELTAEIHELVERQENVLVHCVRGRSRSASVVIAYVMIYQGLAYEDARQFVKNKRAVVGPQKNLVPQLQALESYLSNQRQQTK